MISQLSVFVENKDGRLAAVLRALAEAEVDIEALSLADTQDFGMLRLIVNDNRAAAEALKKIGVVVRETPVIGVDIPNKTGGLSRITDLLEENGIAIKYVYAFLGKRDGYAKVALRVTDDEKALALLKNAGYDLYE